MLFNATLLGLVIAYINARIGKVETKLDARFEVVDARFQMMEERLKLSEDRSEDRFLAIHRRFDAMDQRFDDMRGLWRAELRRVEEVLDARLKHLEQRG